MIEPIILTEYGETLFDDMADLGRGDDAVLSGRVGVHRTCAGFIDILSVSKTHKALLCQKCGLRVVVPKEVETYGDLRKHLE